MTKKVWGFIKENVAAIITVVTAILTVVYAVLRLCIYVYWKGYFTRLNIDVSTMNLNFDKSIFAVIFVSIILFIVIFFMVWVFDIIEDIKKKAKEKQIKGIRKLFSSVKDFGKGLFLSLIILSIINVPLIMMLVSVGGINLAIINMIYLFVLLYIMEMLFIFSQMMTTKRYKKKEKITERDIAIKIIEILAFVLLILAVLFYGGSQAIDKKTDVQLVENEEYMISYCDGEHYVLHKVEYEEGVITIYRNEQKIVGFEECEYSIRKVEKVTVKDFSFE